ncbi:exocyst complex protein exo70 [Tothia fuscella]|uniref:Exocyst complex protein EXO70 n=1 Tax=Tothia fuscella TaxID=1048955 RepID=A0A9P4TYP9_9PEZI|nr:exocyst complex protein exo70 [Tothia fuscella]
MVAPRKAAFAEESAEVEVLYANLEKLKGLTKKIQGSLNRLETSGKSVEEAISPIYGNTRRLQITNTNIDKIIDVIDRIREPLDQRDQEERIIRSDPRKVGIPDYISSLDRATRALAGLKISKLKSNVNAINELSSLLKFGAKQLEDVFRDILRQDTGTIEPLHYLTKNIPFPSITPENVSLLRLINTHVAASVAQTSQTTPQTYPTAKAYSEIRGDYIASSLRNLATASINTTRKQNADAVYRRGQSSISYYSDAIRQMAVTEYNNICPIFARDEWGKMCVATMRNALNEYGKTLRDLNTHIQQNIITDCYLAYEIVDIVSKLAMNLEKQTAELKQPLYDILKPIRETAKGSISRLLEDTRTRLQNMAVLPADAGSVPATTEIMTRLQTLVQFLEPLSSILTSIGDGNWLKGPTSPTSSYTPSIRSFDVGADGDKLFVNYSIDTIDYLLTALENRALLMMKTPGVRGVFLMNNIAIIERMIRSSDLSPLLTPTVIDKPLKKWKDKSKSYTSQWTDLAHQTLLDVQHTSRMRSSSGGAVDSSSVVKALSSKEKDAIKEKFKTFNTGFDDLVAKHKGYRMERETRQQFHNEIYRVIEPLYARFWERYHDIDKGKGKYVKYDKGQMSAIIASLA